MIKINLSYNPKTISAKEAEAVLNVVKRLVKELVGKNTPFWYSWFLGFYTIIQSETDGDNKLVIDITTDKTSRLAAILEKNLKGLSVNIAKIRPVRETVWSGHSATLYCNGLKESI